MYRILYALIVVLFVASPAAAQDCLPEVIPANGTTCVVLGVGDIAWDGSGGGVGVAQSYVYKAYVPFNTTDPVVLPVSCTVDSRSSTGVLCRTPISALGLPVGTVTRVALSASVVAVDGQKEGAKRTIPFDFFLADPDVDSAIPDDFTIRAAPAN